MKQLLLFFAFLCCNQVISQNIPPVSSGNITIIPNQKINFRNLKLVAGEVIFINIATSSEFRYMLNSVKLIVDANNNEIYRNAELIQRSNLPKPKEQWLRLNAEAIDKKQVRAEIILKNGDTLKINVKVKTNLFDESMINELSLNRKITYEEKHEKTILIADDIKQMTIVDFKGSKRVFVPNGSELVERLHDGQVKWFRRFYSNSSGNVSAADFMVNEKQEGTGINYIINTKKTLKKITASQPELVPFIEEMKINDANILELLKQYDQ